MKIARWRLALTGGAVLVLGIVGAGIAQAALSTTAAAPTAQTTGVQVQAEGGAALQTLAAQDVAIRRVAGLRFARSLVHAVVTVNRPTTGLLTVQLDHGTVSAVGSGSLTVSETGGAKVTVATTSATRVRRNGVASTIDALHPGDEVFVASKVAGSSVNASLIVVPKAASPAASPNASSSST